MAVIPDKIQKEFPGRVIQSIRYPEIVALIVPHCADVGEHPKHVILQSLKHGSIEIHDPKEVINEWKAISLDDLTEKQWEKVLEISKACGTIAELRDERIITTIKKRFIETVL